MIKKILKSIKKFKLSLKNKNILTEAANGNYVVTPIIAALAGAKVTALAKNTRYGKTTDAKNQIFKIANKLNIKKNIKILKKKNKIDYAKFDIITNTGHVRPINKKIIKQLKKTCVIPLMWETWEYRKEDIDLDACVDRGIKVYGTNEDDIKLKTFNYLGSLALYFLLENKKVPKLSRILILGSKKFSEPIFRVLKKNSYKCQYISNYNVPEPDLSKFDAIIISEHVKDDLLVGPSGFIKSKSIESDNFIIHICGNVNFKGIKCKTKPKKPAKFGFMSYTCDYIDIQAVIDLHTAGLKVAQGMIKANNMNLKKKDFREYMIKNYPAMSFEKQKYW